MKRLLTALVAGAVVVSGWAQAKIEWTETVHNFGAFDEDLGVATCRFTYRNTGREPLVITGVRATCGCTTPKYDSTPLQPGDTASITVKYDPSGRPGRFSKNVYVDSNTDPTRTTLTIKGVVIGASNTVRSRYPVDMGVLKARNGAMMMGTVKKGQVRNQYLDVYNRSDKAVTPAVVDVPKYLDVVVAPVEIPPGEQGVLNFFFRSNRCNQWGIVTDSVTVIPDIKSGDSERYRIPVVAIVEDDFSGLTDKDLQKAPRATLSDSMADFGNILQTKEPQSRTVRICNTGRSTLQIRRIYTTDEAVEVSCPKSSLKKGACCEITITAHPERLHGALLNTRITVITNDPTEPTRSLRVVGY